MIVLAAVAEFERDPLHHRTRRGRRRRASEASASAGAPARPAPTAVLERRAAGRSWTQVAAELGCSVGKARRLAASTIMSRERAITRKMQNPV